MFFLEYALIIRFCGVELNCLFISALISERNMCGADIPYPSDPIEPLNEQKKKVAPDRNGSIKVHANDSALIKK